MTHHHTHEVYKNYPKANKKTKRKASDKHPNKITTLPSQKMRLSPADSHAPIAQNTKKEPFSRLKHQLNFLTS